MPSNNSDIQFSELISQCKELLEIDKFDQIFDLLAQYNIPKLGSVVLSKALWLRLKIEKMQGLTDPIDAIDREIQIRNSISEALQNLQDTYITTGKGYVETSSGYEVMRPKKNKSKPIILKPKKSLKSFTKQKIISLDDFIGYIEDIGMSRLESSGQLKSLEGTIYTWEGKAGSIVPTNPYSPNSEIYLIFWPMNDKMFQLDPLVAFFSSSCKEELEHVGRGDKVTLRGELQINNESPKITLRNTKLVKHQSKNRLL